MRNNMLFWLFPIVLLAVKLVFDLIPYKPLFFTVTAIILSVAAVAIKRSKVEKNMSVLKELEEMEFEEENDISKYGEKGAEDRKKKVRLIVSYLAETICVSRLSEQSSHR